MQPKFYDYLYPVLKAHENGEVLQVRKMYQIVSEMMGLTEEQKQELIASGIEPMYINRASWAKTYISRAGLIENKGRGLWCITEKGKSWLEKNISLTELDLKMMGGKAFDEFSGKTLNRVNKIAEDAEEIHTQTTPDDQIDAAWKELNKKVSEQLYERIMNNDFYFFERLIIDLMEAMGYGVRFDNGKAMQRTNDEGIDGIINQDKLGLEQIYLQAKRYRQGNQVGGPDLQAFVGALSMKGATKGVFVTTSSFTRAAWDVINNVKDKTIVLVDGSRLLELMLEHDLGVRKERVYEIKAIDLDYFESSE